MDTRKIERYEYIWDETYDWIVVDFKDLKEGDKFRMFEPTGEPVVDKEFNETEFIAKCDAYINEDGIWSIITHEMGEE